MSNCREIDEKKKVSEYRKCYKQVRGQQKQDKREYDAFVDSSETTARGFLMFY